eukprot:726090_1
MADGEEEEYTQHLSSDALEAGLRSGTIFRGKLIVNSHRWTEARVECHGSSVSAPPEIYVFGVWHRNRCIHGDIVAIELLPESEWKAPNNVLAEKEEDEKEDSQSDSVDNRVPTGRIVGVFERNWRPYVVTIQQDDSVDYSRHGRENVLCVPLNPHIPRIRVRTSQALELQDDRLVVSIDEWRIDSKFPEGHYVRSLGPIGDLESETQAIMVENELCRGDFGHKMLECLPAGWSIPEAELSTRLDLRASHLVMSVDPPGCTDIDDALSARELPNGNVELGVHIADVTYFVKPSSDIDNEARHRATTVYLADRRIDMIPPRLSGGECSLHEQVDRLTLSVFWEVSVRKKVKVLRHWFARTVIRSRAALSYGEANCLLSGRMTTGPSQGGQAASVGVGGLDRLKQRELLTEARASLMRLSNVATYLRNRRKEAGALRFGVEQSFESENEFGETEVIAASSSSNSAAPLNSHYIIEEFMIHANRTVAEHIYAHFPDISVLRRHPPPGERKLEEFVEILQKLGLTADVSSNRSLARTLERLSRSQTPEVAGALQKFVIRNMAEASYFPTGSLEQKDFLHYGLAVEFYTHFTSPIRRYADVLVHRLLLRTLEESEDNDVEMSDADLRPLSELCTHLNEQSRRAKHAQRQSKELARVLALTGAVMHVRAVVVELRANGLIVFVPRLPMPGCTEEDDTSARGAVFLKTKDGHFQRPVPLDSLRNQSNDSERIASEEQVAPTCSLALNEKKGRLNLDVPELHYSRTFKVFDIIPVQLSLNLGSGRFRNPRLRFRFMYESAVSEIPKSGKYMSLTDVTDPTVAKCIPERNNQKIEKPISSPTADQLPNDYKSSPNRRKPRSNSSL